MPQKKIGAPPQKPKRVQPSAAAHPPPKPKRNKAATLSPELMDYARQFLLPGEASGDHEIRVAPSLYPSQVCARSLHKVIDVSSATASTAAGFKVVMRPDLYTPGYVTASANTLVPLLGTGYVTVTGDLRGPSGAPLDNGMVARDNTGYEELFRFEVIQDSALVGYRGLNLTPAAAQTIGVNISNSLNTVGTIIAYYKLAGGAWATIPGGTAMSVGSYMVGVYYLALPANAVAVAFNWTTSAGVNQLWQKISLSFPNTQIVNQAVNSLPIAFSRVIDLLDITEGRVTSMACLVTNTSPDIANGGNINAGRVAHDFNIFGNVPGDLSVYPENRRYQGPASTGAYVTWMPAQFDEYEIDTLHSKKAELADADFIFVDVEGWAPPVGSVASARIHLIWNVEFKTQSQLYEKVLTPLRTPEFDALFHALLAMPAATCNPGHLALLKGLLMSGVMGVQKGLQLYGQNKATIDSILSAIRGVLT